MKKILFFIGSISTPRGAERVTTIVANGLVKLGYQVEILSIYKGKKSYYKLNNEIVLNELFNEKIDIKRNYLKILIKLRKFLKLKEIDVLVDVDTLLTLFSFPAKLGLRIKSISWEHFNYETNLGSKNRILARKIALKYSDKIITLTEEDKNEFKKRSKNKDKIVTISNPSSFINETPNILENKKIISVGRLNHQKGYDLLIENWIKIKKQHPEWKLEIAGDGEDKLELEKKIVQLELEDNIKLLGNIKDIKKIYSSASIYIMSSRYEGLPMTLIEAKSFGLPTISFDCKTGPREIIKDNIDGFLIENGKIESLIDKISDLIKNEEKRKQFGKNAFLDERFKKENIIKNWDSVIKQI